MPLPIPPPLRSASHPLIKKVREAARGVRERREGGLFLVEGPRGVEEALEAGITPYAFLVSADRVGRAPYQTLVQRVQEQGFPVQQVEAGLFERMVSAEQGAGMAVLCPLPITADDPEAVLALPGTGLWVLTWEVQNPGNLGTLIRSAAAFGARGLVAAGGADPWNSKAVRASAGAIHRLPLARVDAGAAALPLLALSGHRLLAAVPRQGRPPEAIDWKGRSLLLLGSEVAGLPADLAGRAEAVTIPTSGAVESLSVATAGAILLERSFALRTAD